MIVIALLIHVIWASVRTVTSTNVMAPIAIPIPNALQELALMALAKAVKIPMPQGNYATENPALKTLNVFLILAFKKSVLSVAAMNHSVMEHFVLKILSVLLEIVTMDVVIFVVLKKV